jgi:hypothetical protein
MCFGGGAPAVPVATPPPPIAREQDPVVQASLDAERRRRAQARGYASTMLTTGAGVTAPTAAPTKTALGL